jgi:GxxExxY protein
MTENEIATIVVDACFRVHTALGPGLLESVYENILAYELKERGRTIAQQVPIPVVYNVLKFEQAFYADIIVDQCVILELKSVEKTVPVHKKQLLTYLRLADLRLGLLINFGSLLIGEGITRIVNGLIE